MSNANKADSWFPRFSVAFTLTGAPEMVQKYTIAAAQTIIVGDPVVFSAGASTIEKGASTSGAILGFALEAGTAGDEILVAVADRNTVFMAQADAATSAVVLPLACDTIASGSKWMVDIGATVEQTIRVIGLVPGDDTSDSTDPGRVLFVVHRSEWDGLVAALT